MLAVMLTGAPDVLLLDEPTREVVTSSPIFAPQVGKVLGPWLTVADVEAAL